MCLTKKGRICTQQIQFFICVIATSLVVGKLAATKEAESAGIQRIFPTLLIPTAIVILLLMELDIYGKKIPLIKGVTVQKKV